VTAFELSLVLASALLHAVWSTSIKGSRDPLVFNFYQGGVTVALALVVLPLLDYGEIAPAVWRWLALTSVAHALYFYWLTRAFEHGDLTLVYPIARSTPAFLPLIAVPLLGESLSLGGAFGIAVVVAGMWLVHLGPALRRSAFTSLAARYAYLTLAATVVYSLADKAAMAELAHSPWSSPVPRALAYYTLLALFSTLLFSPVVVSQRSFTVLKQGARSMLLPASIASVLSVLGYGLILKAMETAPASYIVAVRQTSVMFAIVLGVMQLRETPGRTRIAGGLVTVVGVGLIALLGN
jgi:drug/metabolite transporter (DMT)-like permease